MITIKLKHLILMDYIAWVEEMKVKGLLKSFSVKEQKDIYMEGLIKEARSIVQKG